MIESGEEILRFPRKERLARFRPAVIAGVSLGSILFQVYVPRFVESLAYLEVPLLVTVYFALMRRSPAFGVIFGMIVGLAQDSLSHQPIGMFGIVKTLVGYFAASVSLRFDSANAVLRLVTAFFFMFFHQFFYWVLLRALLGQSVDFEFQRTVVLGALNAVVAVPFYLLLDRLKVTD